eukprot:GHVU01084354.1.p3 GENE.GHVU01084354.1~~GHVU01084354.1.p3  ORF type:complete len:176 (+),score=33.11 GHVU01084354.1:112-639(+)
MDTGMATSMALLVRYRYELLRAAEIGGFDVELNYESIDGNRQTGVLQQQPSSLSALKKPQLRQLVATVNPTAAAEEGVPVAMPPTAAESATAVTPPPRSSQPSSARQIRLFLLRRTTELCELGCSLASSCIVATNSESSRRRRTTQTAKTAKCEEGSPARGGKNEDLHYQAGVPS